MSFAAGPVPAIVQVESATVQAYVSARPVGLLTFAASVICPPGETIDGLAESP